MSQRKVTVCQQGTSMLPEPEKSCKGGQWESPRYFIRTKASLLMCEKHARLAMQRNPMGPRFVKVKPGAVPAGYCS